MDFRHIGGYVEMVEDITGIIDSSGFTNQFEISEGNVFFLFQNPIAFSKPLPTEHNMPLTRLLLFITLPLYILDQITKAWTVKNFAPPWSYDTHAWEIVPGWFHWIRVHNQGVAFGMGNGTTWAPIVFLFVPLIALTLIYVFWKKGVFEHIISRVAVALLLCGIFGNLTDRLVQGFLLEEFKGEGLWTRLCQGYVVDFIAVKLPLYDKLVPSSGGWWPTFNIADSCIFIAAGLLFIGGMKEEKARAAAEKKSRESAS